MRTVPNACRAKVHKHNACFVNRIHDIVRLQVTVRNSPSVTVDQDLHKSRTQSKTIAHTTVVLQQNPAKVV